MHSNTATHQSSENSGPSGNGNALIRSDLRNCSVRNARLQRCTLENCVLTNVRSAQRIQACHSAFHDVASLTRSEFVDSVVRDRSAVVRGTVKNSVVRDASTLTRSDVLGTTLSHSQLSRACLENCDASNCVISRSNFKGMVLKYGVWERGRLLDATVPAVAELDSKAIPVARDTRTVDIDSDALPDSEDSDLSDDLDLPPPYKP
ncbi:hypothetical protein NUU61_000131 [Penicillium alfredii]|uniref:Uncharacterized protein n=1 Tax=Penicillium alfredii TaxID=1506179 RepID=A0A9W9G9B5_9EURO|nr:uncharacterized protein NUU61_000131 [Penicillium alfredii]KAJ5114372.1 hypothetical protein NUU61_000131 [Penicillium alfredii]